MSRIHPSAVVSDGAKLGADVEIGPYAVVEAGVVLGDGVAIGPHSVLFGPLQVGQGTRLSAHVVLGGQPQDRKHDRSVETTLIIGADNDFREFSSAHRGTSTSTRETLIGDGNLFMANSHVAHDCRVGSHTMFSNSAAIAGHVSVEDGAILGGLSAVHQFCRIGRLSMLGGGAMCAQDVPPFCIAQGDRARLFGLNIIGLRRSGADIDTVDALKRAWRLLFTEGLPRKTAVLRAAESNPGCDEVDELLDFLRTSERGVCRAGIKA